MCLEVSNGGIHYKNCSNFLMGCPETNFKSTEFYKCKFFLSLRVANFKSTEFYKCKFFLSLRVAFVRFFVFLCYMYTLSLILLFHFDKIPIVLRLTKKTSAIRQIRCVYRAIRGLEPTRKPTILTPFSSLLLLDR